MITEVPVATNSVLSPEETLRIFTVHPYVTSWRLHWSGIEAHRYRVPGADTPMHSFPRLAVFVSHVTKPVRSVVHLAGNRMSAQVTGQTISIAPPGTWFRSSFDKPREVTVIFLEPGAVADVAAREDAILPQFAIRDPLIRELGLALDREMMSAQPNARVYAESLATAMATHIIATYANPSIPKPSIASLTRTQLKRSIDFINDNATKDLTLSEIAAVANMSKYHFAKSFREMMKIAPHQYLVKLRIEKARHLLTMDSLSIEEIANLVGYSDKTHFAAQFRKIVGVTPHEYRTRS